MNGGVAMAVALCDTGGERLGAVMFGFIPLTVWAFVVGCIFVLAAQRGERRGLLLVLLIAMAVGGIAYVTAQGEGGKQFKIWIAVAPVAALAAGFLTRRFSAWKGAMAGFVGAFAVPFALFAIGLMVLASNGECIAF